MLRTRRLGEAVVLRSFSGAELPHGKMFTVYLIRSTERPGKTYVGYTADLEYRLHDHNTGKVRTTKGCGPWQVEVAIQFKDETKAKAFERYLKHGSGHAFAKRHFW